MQVNRFILIKTVLRVPAGVWSASDQGAVSYIEIATYFGWYQTTSAFQHQAIALSYL